MTTLSAAAWAAEHSAPLVRVLVVDDDESVRSALSDLIGDDRSLLLVGAAADAAAAAELAVEVTPDVAIVDVRMPGGGGVELTRTLRVVCPQTIVIGLSSYGDRHTTRDMLAAGAARFLVKGDTGADLLDTIAEVVAERAAAGGSGRVADQR